MPAKEDQQRARRPARPPAAPEAGAFLAVAQTRLRAIEQAAEAAASDLAVELEPLVSELSSREDREAARVRAIGDAMVKQVSAIADRCRRTRKWLASSGIEAGEELSPGVALLARQMARDGTPQAEIEELLQGMGVDRPDAIIRRALREAGR